MTEELPYRKNVAVVVINEEGLLLACHRNDRKGAWQLPQGGVDDGEGIKQAMIRELEEEIGTSEVEIIGQLSTVITYEWPTHVRKLPFRGQEQVYFLVRLRDESKLDLYAHKEPEFDKYEWVNVQEFFSRLSGFKEAPYREGISGLIREFPGYIVE